MSTAKILGALVLAIALAAGAYLTGHSHGVDEQMVADQRQFDRINAERAQQKADAAALYQKAQADVIATLAERDELKRKLEVQDAKNREATAALVARYAGLGLRFGADQGGTDRPHGAGTAGTQGDAARTGGTSVVQLPDAIARDLRSLTADADRLADEYRKCYGYLYPATLN